MNPGLAFALGAALGLLPYFAALLGAIHLHRWSRWSAVRIHKKQFGQGEMRVSGQLRRCRRCGREQVREVQQ